MAVYQVTYKIGDEELVTNRDHPNVKYISKKHDEQSSYFRVYYTDDDVVDIYFPIEVVWRDEVKINVHNYKDSKRLKVYTTISGLEYMGDKTINTKIFETVEEYDKYITYIKNMYNNCIITIIQSDLVE